MGGGVSKSAELAAMPASSGTPTAAVAAMPSDHNTGPSNEAVRRNSKRRDSGQQPKREPTNIDARIIQTLRERSLQRRAVHARAMNFERIALQFGIAREAFETIQCIYDQFANEAKGGLDYDGLKAALEAIGAHMNATDMREIFYESDMVRDNSLSKNEFVVSLAISYLLGLITTFEHIARPVRHSISGAAGEAAATTVAAAAAVPEDTSASEKHADVSAEAAETPPPIQSSATTNEATETPREPQSARDTSVCFTNGSPQLVAKALELMVTAYLLFDDDASGTIQVTEVRNIMRKHNGTPTSKGGSRTGSSARLERKASGIMSKSIQIARIKELDVDQDGTITFQEFVLTFQKWVRSDDDDDEEDANEDDDDGDGY